MAPPASALGHRVLGHHGLAGPGGRGDEDRAPLVQRPDGADLEVVELEVVPEGGRGLGHQAASDAARRRSMNRPARIEAS